MSAEHLFVVLPSSDEALAHREALTRAGIAHTVVAQDGRALPPDSPVLIVSPESIGLFVDEIGVRFSRAISPDDLATVLTTLLAMRARAADERLVTSMKTHDAGNLLLAIVSGLHVVLHGRQPVDPEAIDDLEEASLQLGRLLRQGPRVSAPQPIDVRPVVATLVRLLHPTPGVPVDLAPMPEALAQVAIAPVELERSDR